MGNFLNDYVNFVDKTTSDSSKHTSYFKETCDIVNEQGMAPERMLTAALGLSAESGEFTEIVKKVIFQGKPMDDYTKHHMKRELGDVMWYVAQACIALDTDLSDIITMNISKLEDRYPDGFEVTRSENRAKGDI